MAAAVVHGKPAQVWVVIFYKSCIFFFFVLDLSYFSLSGVFVKVFRYDLYKSRVTTDGMEW